MLCHLDTGGAEQQTLIFKWHELAIESLISKTEMSACCFRNKNHLSEVKRPQK